MRTYETDRLRLRPWRDEDLEPFAALNVDPRVMEHMPAPLTRKESDRMAGLIRTRLEAQGIGLWAVEVRDGPTFAGFVGLMTPPFDAPFTPCVEIGWRLSAQCWGRGYATEAAREALRIGFGEHDLAEIVSFTVPANRASLRVMEKIGMTRDRDGDFDHPRVAEGHPLRPHVLYRLSRSRWLLPAGQGRPTG